MQIHFDTYKVSGQRQIGDRTVDTYSVEITIRGDRREVACSGIWNDHITIWAWRFASRPAPRSGPATRRTGPRPEPSTT